MHEAFLVAANIDEGGIETLHYLLDLAEVDVAHHEARVFLLVEFDQTLVFEESDLYAVGFGCYY